MLKPNLALKCIQNNNKKWNTFTFLKKMKHIGDK